jgi:hypothetical protein
LTVSRGVARHVSCTYDDKVSMRLDAWSAWVMAVRIPAPARKAVRLGHAPAIAVAACSLAGVNRWYSTPTRQACAPRVRPSAPVSCIWPWRFPSVAPERSCPTPPIDKP